MYIIETIEFDACKIRRLKQALELGICNFGQQVNLSCIFSLYVQSLPKAGDIRNLKPGHSDCDLNYYSYRLNIETDIPFWYMHPVVFQI